jgi:hypothetical protein
MTRRRLRRPSSDQSETENALPTGRLPPKTVTLPTSLIYKGKPVQWHDGVLYVDGRRIARSSQP